MSLGLPLRKPEGRTMGNDTHVTDVGRAVHETTDLVCKTASAIEERFTEDDRVLTDGEVTAIRRGKSR